MRRRFLGMLLLLGAFAGFSSGIAHVKHAHHTSPCHDVGRAGGGLDRRVVVPEHIHDAEGRVYVRPDAVRPAAPPTRHR